MTGRVGSRGGGGRGHGVLRLAALRVLLLPWKRPRPARRMEGVISRGCRGTSQRSPREPQPEPSPAARRQEAEPSGARQARTAQPRRVRQHRVGHRAAESRDLDADRRGARREGPGAAHPDPPAQRGPVPGAQADGQPRTGARGGRSLARGLQRSRGAPARPRRVPVRATRARARQDAPGPRSRAHRGRARAPRPRPRPGREHPRRLRASR